MMHSIPESAKNWEDPLRSFLLQKPQKPLLVLVGPTASGKTALSIRMAAFLRSLGLAPEVVNADSRQMYRGLDIGTAKITEAEMDGVPHHLLSVLDPAEKLSIARFQEMARVAIDDIHRRGAVPILVGGSMLYVSSIVDGLVPQESDPALRAKLVDEYDIDGGISLHARLAALDPDSAASIPRENRTYVVRAMEIVEMTGKPKSSALTRTASPYDVLIFGIAVEASQLRERLTKRTAQMFAAGWVDEVRRLLASGCRLMDPAMESHGYRDIAAALAAGEDPSGLAETIVTKGMQYAKRHRTWWKDDERVHWIQAS